MDETNKNPQLQIPDAKVVVTNIDYELRPMTQEEINKHKEADNATT